MWMRVLKVKNFDFSAHQFIRIKNKSTILERQENNDGGQDIGHINLR